MNFGQSDHSTEWWPLIESLPKCSSSDYEQMALRVLRTPEIHQEVLDVRKDFSIPLDGIRDAEINNIGLTFSTCMYCQDNLLPKYKLDEAWAFPMCGWIIHAAFMPIFAVGSISISERRIGNFVLQHDHARGCITIPCGQNCTDEVTALLRALISSNTQSRPSNHQCRDSMGLKLNLLIARSYANGLSKPADILFDVQNAYAYFYNRPIAENPSFNLNTLYKRIQRFDINYPCLKKDITSPLWMSDLPVRNPAMLLHAQATTKQEGT